MKISIIMSDAAGYPNRAAHISNAAAAAGASFHRVTPVDCAAHVSGAHVIDIPETWLPSIDKPTAWKHWFRNHLHYIIAARDLCPDADFYWCVEADVAASRATWIRLLETTADMPEDGLWTRLYHRDESPANGWFTAEGCPGWANWYCLGALFRVSARALHWWEQKAEETREIFTELCAPSLIHRAGGSIAKINRPHHPSFYHVGTMRFNPKRSAIRIPEDPTRFRHPVKSDDPPDPPSSSVAISAPAAATPRQPGGASATLPPLA